MADRGQLRRLSAEPPATGDGPARRRLRARDHHLRPGPPPDPGPGHRHRCFSGRHRGGHGRPAPTSRRSSFEQGDLFHLAFDDGTFDVVHAHQVLQHVGDPVAALAEMRRVCRPGGIVAARDGDYPAMTYFPDGPRRWSGPSRRTGASPGATGPTGMRGGSCWPGPSAPASPRWSRPHRPGASPPPRSGPGGETCGPIASPESALADQLLAHGIATREDLSLFAGAYRRWAEAPGGWFAVVHGEVLCTV